MESLENKIKIVPKIRQLREEEQITQLELSQLVGVTETSIQNWERGRSGIEQIERVVKLCKALDCNPSDLIEYILYENTNNLGKWLEDNFTEAFNLTWKKPKNIFANSSENKNNKTRFNQGKESKSIAKIINFPENKGVILLLQFDSEKENKIGVTAKLYPLSDDEYLPSNLKLELISQSGKTLQQIESQSEDILIQTQFKVKKTNSFSIKVSLFENSIIENFTN